MRNLKMHLCFEIEKKSILIRLFVKNIVAIQAKLNLFEYNLYDFRLTKVKFL